MKKIIGGYNQQRSLMSYIIRQFICAQFLQPLCKLQKQSITWI